MDLKVSNCNRRQLYRYLRFYRLYPEIVGAMSPQLKKLLPARGQAVDGSILKGLSQMKLQSGIRQVE